MASNDTSMGGRGRDFPSTSWSSIARVRDPNDPSCRAFLEQLIATYWKPAYYYIRASGRHVEDAKDLAQAFFTRLVEKHHLERVDPERGSFRGFLKRSLKNFLLDASRREAARRPSEGKVLFRFDECQDDVLPASMGPEELFDREWNQSLLRSCLETLEGDLGRRNLKDYFSVFRAYCFPEDPAAPLGQAQELLEKDPPKPQRYADIARRFGITEVEVQQRLARCRHELKAILKARIREYARDEEEAEGEYRRVIGG